MSVEQYDNICKDEFKKIQDALHSLEKRLFIDNGTKSIQTRLNEYGAWQKSHDVLQMTKTNPISFTDWLMANWKSISGVVFVLVWLITQFYPGKGFNPEQQQEIKALLKTVIVDTRIQ